MSEPSQQYKDYKKTSNKRRFNLSILKSKKIAKIFPIILILIGLIFTLILVKQKQDNRNYASENDLPKNLLVNKSNVPEYKKGEIIVKFSGGIDSQSQNTSGLAATSLKSTRTNKRKIETSKVAPLVKINKKYPIKNVENAFTGIRPTKSTIQSANGYSLKQDNEQGSSIYKIEFQDENLNPYVVAKDLKDEAGVVYAEPNYIYYGQNYSDPYYLDTYPNSIANRDPKWNPNYDYQWNLKNIKAEEANNKISNKLSIIVAVIDTGVDYTHPEFGACNLDQVISNNCASITSGFNFVGEPSEESVDPMDRFGHGTHVAGIISASSNDKGIAGETYGIKIMPVKGLNDNGAGTMEDLAQSIYFAVDKGAKVINASWGGAGNSKTLADAINYAYSKGVVFVAAAGNSNIDVKYFSPANITCSSTLNPTVDCVLTVASLGPFQAKSFFSNYGSGIDVSAPGEEIISLKSGKIASDFNNFIVGGNYIRMSGTSMAAPHVAALAALVLQKNQNLNPNQVRNVILNGVDDYGNPSFDNSFGFGKINAEKSLNDMNASDLPIAKISTPLAYTRQGNKFKIYGSSSGPKFMNYKISILDNKSNPEGNINGVKLENDGKTQVNNGLLANIDMSSYSENTYTVLLTTNSSNGNKVTSETHVILDKTIRDGFPILFNSESSLYPPLISDINNDGKKEIIYQSSSKAMLYVLDSNGRNFPGWPKSTGLKPSGVSYFIGFDSTPIAVDIDPESAGKEIIFPVSNKEVFRLDLLAFHTDGSPVPGWTRADWDRRPFMGHIAYMNNGLTAKKIDGKTIIALVESFPAGYLVPWNTPYRAYLMDSKGNLLPGWPINLSPITIESRPSYTAPIITDLENNGSQEISILENGRRLIVYDISGKLIRKIELGLEEKEYYSNWLLTDLDSNGKKEFIISTSITTGDYPNFAIKNKVHIFNADGSRYSDKWPITYSFNSDRYIKPYVSVGDFNNDKKPDIAAYSYSKLHILDVNASELPGSPFIDPTSTYDPIITNVSNSDGSSLISITNPTYWLDQIKLINYSNGSFLNANRYPKSFYNEYSSGFTSGYPSLEDLDNDGKIDFTVPVNANTGLGFLMNIDNYLYSFNTNIFMNNSDWPQYLRNDSHSNSFVISQDQDQSNTTTLYPAADAFVRSSEPDKNFGSENFLQNDSVPDEIIYIKFNLTSLKGKTIKSAKLYLTVSNPTKSPLNLRRSDEEWSESGITYNHRPKFVWTYKTYTEFKVNELNSKMEFDVATAVDNFKGEKLTFGIKALEDDQGSFYSKEHSNVSYRPKLVVGYQ